MADPALPLEVIIDVLRARLRGDRGFTVDVWSGRPVEEGIAVAADPAAALRFHLGAWDDDTVAGWVAACRSRARARSDLFVGGWHPDGGDDVHLDLVRVLPEDRHLHARFLGLVRSQRAVFDLSSRTVLPVRAAVG